MTHQPLLTRLKEQACRRRREMPSQQRTLIGYLAIIFAFCAFASQWMYPVNSAALTVLTAVLSASWLGIMSARAAQVTSWLIVLFGIGYAIFRIFLQPGG